MNIFYPYHHALGGAQRHERARLYQNMRNHLGKRPSGGAEIKAKRRDHGSVWHRPVMVFAFLPMMQTPMENFSRYFVGIPVLYGGTRRGRTFARGRGGRRISSGSLPGDRSGLLVAKIFVNVVLSCLTMAFVLPLLVVLMDVALVDPDNIAVNSWVCLQLLSGIVGFAVVATPLAVMADRAIAEVLLPLIIFDGNADLIAGVSGTGIALGTAVGDSILPWLKFTWGFVREYSVWSCSRRW